MVTIINPVRLARSAPMRYALAFAGLVAIAMGVLLAVVYWSVTWQLEAQLTNAIDQQVRILRDDFAQDGREAMVTLAERLAPPERGNLHVLVLDRSGKRLTGDLPALEPVAGWQDIPLPSLSGSAGNNPRVLRGRGVWFDRTTFVLVAQDTAKLAESRRLILRSFAVALGVTVALALGGGLFIGVALMRRVDAASRAAQAIMDGDLGQRLPLSGHGDELDRLVEALNRMLGRIEALMDDMRHVTSDIAHDLRTPLGRLRQRLDEVRAGRGDRAEHEAAVDAAIGDSKSILRTFDAMLRIAQIDAGSGREHFAPVDLSEVTRAVCEAYDAVAEDGGRRLSAHLQSGLTVLGESELLTRLLVNLVENALAHTPPGTQMAVAVEALHGGVRLSVSDDGPGIPPAQRERVLGRFHRLDASRSTPGSGLGLSLVAAVAKLHGARLVLEDNAPGLRVLVDFPSPASAEARR